MAAKVGLDYYHLPWELIFGKQLYIISYYYYRFIKRAFWQTSSFRQLMSGKKSRMSDDTDEAEMCHIRFSLKREQVKQPIQLT